MHEVTQDHKKEGINRNTFYFPIMNIVFAFLIFVSTIYALFVPKRPSFDRIFIVVLENLDYEDALKDEYFGKTLASKGRILTNMHGVIHPSQQNYIAMTSGKTYPFKADFKFSTKARNIVDLLEQGNKSWTTYQEDYPLEKGCYEENYPSGLFKKHKYVRKHNPFISFDNILNNPKRCQNIKNSQQLYKDINENNLSNYIFYTPNMDNNGHDTNPTKHSAKYASNWLKGR
jgi:hypothetical protein